MPDSQQGITDNGERFFHELADNAPVMIWRTGLDMLCDWFNKPWLEFTGRTMGQELGNGWAEGVHRDDFDRCLEIYQAAFNAREPFTMIYRLRRHDGQYREILDNGAPFSRDGAFAGYFGSCIDVTEQRVLESQLHQSQKMESVGQLTGGIAHDFNNMLAVVIGSLDLLIRRVGVDDARAKRYIDAAREAARRAADLTQRLLAFSRQQPLRPEQIDANKLVSGMSDLLRHSLGGDVSLETILASGLWPIRADPNLLETVILNLAINARDAMTHGGHVTIETQNAHLDDRDAAAHPGLAAGQYVLISTTDTGSGMPVDVIEKAFDPFFTTKEVGKGTGLGLSQVHGFVKQSKGHVKIHSEVGHGTTVSIYLPRLIAPTIELAEDVATRAIPLGENQELILVVEDEAAVRQFSMDALSELGYSVLEADSAAAALRLINAHPEISLMFTDIVMPHINGAELSQEARRRRPNLKVLFTTGYTHNAVDHSGELGPGPELLGKPFSIDELAVKVRSVLDAPAGSSRDNALEEVGLPP